MMNTGKNELPPEVVETMKELLEEEFGQDRAELYRNFRLFTTLEIIDHLEVSPSVYKNSDILRRNNNENTI